jgi:hypothetical protein
MRSILVLATLFVLGPSPRADMVDGMQSCVVRIGDADGDGHDDLLVASRDGLPECVWLISGATGQVLHEFRGQTVGDGFGCALARISDLDGDKAPDLVIAARGGTQDPLGSTGFKRKGSVYIDVFSSKSGARLRHIEVPDVATTRVSLACGDLDADGVMEIVVGIAQASLVRIYSAADGKLLREITPPSGQEGSFGASLLIVEDLDGDGWADIVVGHPEARQADPSSAVSPRLGAVVLYSSRDGVELRRIWGEGGKEPLFGATLARTGDLDGDHRDDLAVAAEGISVRLLSIASFAPIGEAIDGGNLPVFGSSLDSVSDQDGDGKPELLIGSNDSIPTFFARGGAQIVRSKSGPKPGTVYTYSTIGIDVAAAGRIDDDSIEDVAFVEHCRDWKCGNPGGELRLRSGTDLSQIWKVELPSLRRGQAQTSK